jgi:hypothetical protein
MAEFEVSFQVSSFQGVQCTIALLWQRHSVYIVSSVIVFALNILCLSNQFLMPLASFGLGVVCILWYGWISSVYRANAIFKKISGLEINIRFGEEYIEIKTMDGVSTLRWSAFSHLHRTKSNLILQRRYFDYYSSIPTKALTPDARNFLELKLREAHVQIL